MNELFLGLDISFSGTGLVILDRNGNIIKQDEISTNHDKNNIYDIEERMIRIVDIIKKDINEYKDKIYVTYIEDVVFGAKGDSSTQLAALNYFIRVNLFNMGMKYFCISPTQLKKYISGNGQAKKQLMLKEVYKRWGQDFNSDNICDAYSLARFSLDDYDKGIFELTNGKVKIIKVGKKK